MVICLAGFDARFYVSSKMGIVALPKVKIARIDDHP
jgi:hypothetical protein